jgi:hypothetical protein
MRNGHTAWRAAARAIALLALVLVAARQNRHLAAVRRAGLPGAPAYATQAPPLLNFVTVGLAGFRGIAAEILWTRADRLQNEGRYLELIPLTDWTTGLDPHAIEAWAYSAWNLAYNVSAMMPRPRDRLGWVDRGVRLLRDRALPGNPHNARLHRELAWLYQHKIGGPDDEAGDVYRMALAAAMAPCVNADGTVAGTPEASAALQAMRLDPDRLRTLERRYGPLDWRMAASHAVYWASRGVEYATGHERRACRRAVYQPLIAASLAGRFAGDLTNGVFRAAPNPALVPATVRELEDTEAEFPSRTLRLVCGRYLVLAIRWAQAAGRPGDAAAWYRDLQRIGAGVLAPVPLPDLLQGRDPEPLSP